MKIGGAILAGGRSKRMGTDKGLLKIGNKTMTEMVIEQLQTIPIEKSVISANSTAYDQFSLKRISDLGQDKGPLAGIQSVLKDTDCDAVLFTTCDMPFVQAAIYQKLINSYNGQSGVFLKEGGNNHYLLGIYAKSALPLLNQCIESGSLKVREFILKIGAEAIELEEEDLEQFRDQLVNINDPETFKNKIGEL